METKDKHWKEKSKKCYERLVCLKETLLFSFLITGTQLPPVPGAAMAGFPWWPWLIAVALFVLILALVFLLLLCALCNCFKRFPCCSDFCGVLGCFDQCYKSLDRCCASCCPCYGSDEDERAG